MAITASMVADLRAKADAPMMECKKALTEANGDMDKAEEILRVKLGNKAGKAASRVTAEGVIVSAIDGKTGQNVEALIPSTGGLLFFDVMVIPADAPRPGNAQKFINFILTPEVDASLTNKVFYANPNLASKPFVKPEVANNPSVFLSPDNLKKMVPPDALNNDLRRLMTRAFTSFKTGL